MYSSDARLPISPATEKKRMQRLNLSPEKKKVEQDKKRLYMKRCHEAQSLEKKTADQDKKRLSKKRCREAESIQKRRPSRIGRGSI